MPKYPKKETRNTKEDYYIVQQWMIADLCLKGIERDLYAIIYNYSKHEMGTYNGTTKYAAKFLGVTPKSIKSATAKLKTLNLIYQVEEHRDGTHEAVKYRITPDAVPGYVTEDDHHTKEDYFVVQQWMMSDLGLRGITRDLFALIYSYSKHEMGIYNGTTSYAGEFLGVAQISIKRVIAALRKNNLIYEVDEHRPGAQTAVKYRVNMDVVPAYVTGRVGERKNINKPVIKSDRCKNDTGNKMIPVPVTKCRPTGNKMISPYIRDNKGIVKNDNKALGNKNNSSHPKTPNNAYSWMDEKAQVWDDQTK